LEEYVLIDVDNRLPVENVQLCKYGWD